MATPAETAMESHSIEPIPESDKTSRPIDQFWIWSGANIAVTNWFIGTLGIVFGLSFWATAITFVVGNLVGSALFAAVAVMGAKTGVGQMVLSRAPFGRRGAYLIAIVQLLMCIGWIGVNSVFSIQAAIQLLGLAGIPDTTLTKLVVVLGIYAVQIAIGAYGYYAITKFERIGVPLTMGLMVVLTILVFASGRLNLGYAGRLSGPDQLGTMAAVFAAVGIGWGISWTTWAADYSRYVPSSVPSRSVFWANYLGMFVCTVWLGVLGAMTATITPEAPGDLAVVISQLFGWFSIPAFLIVVYGVTSTNVLNIHSGALAAMTADIRVSRPMAALISGVLGGLITFYSLFLSDIAKTMDLWMLTLLVWVTPWLAIVLVDFYLLRRGVVDVDGLYEPPERSRYGDVVWPAVISWALGFALSYLWANTPMYTGPLAKATGGSDFSWVIAFVVSGGLYLFLRRRGVAPSPAPAV